MEKTVRTLIWSSKFNRELKKLLDYVEPDEARHYEEVPKEERRKHIYTTIKFLRKSING